MHSTTPVSYTHLPCGAFHDAELHGFILHGLFDFLRIAAFQPYAYFRIMAVEHQKLFKNQLLRHALEKVGHGHRAGIRCADGFFAVALSTAEF